MTTKIFVIDAGAPVRKDDIAAPFRPGPNGIEPRTPTADYTLTDDPTTAHVAALARRWEVHSPSSRTRALKQIEEIGAAGLATIVWVGGDHEARIPAVTVVRYQHGALRNRADQRGLVRCYPSFFADPLDGGGAAERINAIGRPSVGFCGHARQNLLSYLRLAARKAADHGRHGVRVAAFYPEPWRSHLGLRRRVLRVLAESDLIEDDFVMRDRYRAGLTERSARHDPLDPTNLEFTDNILRTDFTLCVRGGGNFSNRLVEVMALGRIPIIVDSGSRLPWEDELDWHRLAIIVPERQLDDLPAIVAERHDRAGPSGIEEWQQRCRTTWATWLSLNGFFSRFGASVAQLAG